MTVIWTRPDGGVTLGEHALVVDDLELRTLAFDGTIVARAMSREDALGLAAAIQVHYADVPVDSEIGRALCADGIHEADVPCCGAQR